MRLISPGALLISIGPEAPNLSIVRFLSPGSQIRQDPAYFNHWCNLQSYMYHSNNIGIMVIKKITINNSPLHHVFQHWLMKLGSQEINLKLNQSECGIFDPRSIWPRSTTQTLTTRTWSQNSSPNLVLQLNHFIFQFLKIYCKQGNTNKLPKSGSPRSAL